MSRSSGSSGGDSPLLVGLLLGLLQGVLLGILLAPRPGAQTNKHVNEFLSEWPKQLQDDNPNKLAFLKRARIRFENGVNRVRHAIEADRQAAAKRREALAEPSLLTEADESYLKKR
jgi:hypothetical protein